MTAPAHAPAPPPPVPVDSPGSAARWLWAALVLGAAGAAVAALVAAGWAPLLGLDRAAVRWLHVRALAHPEWTVGNRLLSDWVWDPVTMRALIVAAAVWAWLRRERLLAVWCGATAAAGAVVQQGLKALIGRERPQWRQPVDSAEYAAMPSGHAMTAAVACVLLLWLVRRAWADGRRRALAAAVACASVAGVSFTRVALGVHWPTDTLAGSALGAAVAAAAVGLWHARTDGDGGAGRRS